MFDRSLAASAAIAIFANIAATAPVAAQGQKQGPWPQRAVRFIIPLPPGSGMDLSARVMAERLSPKWGQAIVVENRQGADGIPAVTAFFSARDNHTFLFSFGGVVTFNHLLHAKLPYDPAELLPIAPVIDNFLGVSVTSLLKVNTLAELVKAAKAQPGKLNYAATPGLPVYVLQALQRYAGITMANVPYRDFAPAYQDLNQGRLHIIGTGVPTQVAHHRAGTAKLLFVTNRERSPQVPDVPTAKEAGFPDLTFEGVAGLYGWRNMPAEIKQRLVTDVAAIVADPDFRARVLKVGTVPRSGTTEEFAAAIAAQREQVVAIHKAIAKPKE
ncbi:MAG: tripartite tricarboxylate transporter substrate binding protein [Rhizobiales bacterium]|nr:tripartite tricarboxylate transporter substrate binding protein [Hyphomicrobiales bacterium]